MSDYNPPDPLPPPLPIFNSINWITPDVVQAGGGGGGGAITYNTQTISLTGLTGEIEFQIPADTRSFFLDVTFAMTGGSNTIYIQLGDAIGYYNAGYVFNTLPTNPQFSLISLSNTARFVGQFMNGGLMYGLSSYTFVPAGAVRNQNGALTGVTAPITKIKIYNSGIGSGVIDAGTIAILSCVIQP